MNITRSEPATGGNLRTRREEIVPLITGPRGAEPEVYLDCSGSMTWEIAPPEKSAPSRWTVLLPALRSFLRPFEELDEQASREQAGGSQDKGGVYTYPFNHQFLPLGAGDDDGDLNLTNFEEKMKAFEATYGVPGGGTQIMTAVRAGDQHFLAEFGARGENPRARGERPIRARVVFTDGELKDAGEFAAYLAEARVQGDLGVRPEWDEVWAIAILGHGEDHDKTLRQYQQLAAQHPNLHVYSFAEVSNPEEIAEDMAIAVVPQPA
jgi:hypothetical protein